MVVIECSENGLLAVINSHILRVYNINQSKLVFKDELSCSASSEKNGVEENQNTTFSCGCSFSYSGNYLAVFSDNKELSLWRTSETTEDWKQVGKRKVNKKPTAVLITNMEDYVVISDKAGDVYRYAIRNELSTEDLLLGHVSMILDLIISRNDQYLITCDRDEKIRICCYPNAYNIASFCLGHKEYVMKVALLESHSNILVSASGDATVRFWDYTLGKLIHTEKLHTPSEATPVISCLACSTEDSLVFVGTKQKSLLYAFKFSKNNTVGPSISKCDDVQLDGSPCSLTIDHQNRLWVVQSWSSQAIVIFDIVCINETYQFNKVCCSDINGLLSTEGWDTVYDSLKELPLFENLSKKEGLGTCEYYNRKKERVEEKAKKINQKRKPHNDKTTSAHLKKLKT